jgi:hypothetical protein
MGGVWRRSIKLDIASLRLEGCDARHTQSGRQTSADLTREAYSIACIHSSRPIQVRAIHRRGVYWQRSDAGSDRRYRHAFLSMAQSGLAAVLLMDLRAARRRPEAQRVDTQPLS